jgi:hypothetical protein
MSSGIARVTHGYHPAQIATQTTICTVPLSTITVIGSADGDSRSDTDHSLS